jgi:hypothetical protein
MNYEGEIRRTLFDLEKEYRSWKPWYCKDTSCTAYPCVQRKKKLEEIETRRMLKEYELDLYILRKKRILVN